MKFLKYPIAEFMTWLDFHLGVMSESKVNDVNYKQTSPDQKYISFVTNVNSELQTF